MSDSDVPFLAALTEVAAPTAPDGAGGRFLLAAAAAGASSVPAADADVWAVWVDLALWPVPDRPVGEEGITAHARADLTAVATRLVARLTDDPEDAVEDAADDGGRRIGLTAEQDARLRTLAALRELGELSPELQELRRSLRARDQRTAVRPPAPVVWPSPRASGGAA